MADMNWVATIVGVLFAGGIGATIREIVGVVTLARKGVSGKEQKRRDDIVAQRDYALAQMRAAQSEADAHEARADREAVRRQKWQEEVAKLRRLAIEHGRDPGPWPDIDETTDPIRPFKKE
jgi:hypothetical protein